MIYENISLKKYNTFGINIKADRMITFKMEENAIRFFSQRNENNDRRLILGGGSNLLFTEDFHGTIIHPGIDGINVEEKKSDYVIVSCGAGVVWDNLVEMTVRYGFGGLENLSLIPGQAGAAPVQNIGAYGKEVRETIEKVRAVDITNGTVKEFSNNDCNFGYRNSIFKSELKGRFLITRVWFRLSTRPKLSLEYGSLRDEVTRLGATSLNNVRKIVINTRRSRLPDPLQTGNAGSFFKNPVISEEVADNLKSKFEGMPVFRDHAGCTKLAAAWMIEQCGWKGKNIGDAGVHDRHALVLVNRGNAKGSEIFDLSEKIRNSVFEKFGILLEREVEVVGVT